ncbi:MAG: NAD-dependent deacylase [Bacteroidia bacterium]|nr:NAD-dependent deacylase [Bacteroidia bacterium]
MTDKNKSHLVVLSGAGISAESGLKTFRDSDGLWEGYSVEDVATPEAFLRNPLRVLKFYNERRKAAIDARPNEAHLMLAALEEKYTVSIITQNVDDLHERAGSTSILHLHGLLNKSQSIKNPSLIYDVKGTEINMGDLCELGSQLRPFIVWFGEDVPMITEAVKWVQKADILLVIGTSLQVYPAAGLLKYFPSFKPLYVIDPKPIHVLDKPNYTQINEIASKGMNILVKKYL